MKVMDIQEKVGRGEYHVDENAVAAAILRRLLGDRGQQHNMSSGGASA